jgi:hypothetical protein
VSIVDSLNGLWNQILELLSKLVIPDWGSLIGLLPIFLVLGVLGPIASILFLAWFIYIVRRPRVGMRYEDGPRKAELDGDGKPIFPAGLPHCLADGLIYPSGATRCDEDGSELWVRCPMCGLGRAAGIKTCGNCGLVLNVKTRALTLGPTTGPPPGGAAAA